MYWNQPSTYKFVWQNSGLYFSQMPVSNLSLKSFGINLSMTWKKSFFHYLPSIIIVDALPNCIKYIQQNLYLIWQWNPWLPLARIYPSCNAQSQSHVSLILVLGISTHTKGIVIVSTILLYPPETNNKTLDFTWLLLIQFFKVLKSRFCQKILL